MEILSISVPAGSLLTEICAFLPLIDDTEVENDEDLKAMIIIPIPISWIQVDEPSSAIIIIHGELYSAYMYVTRSGSDNWYAYITFYDC